MKTKFPERFAKELISVQPMSSDFMKGIMEIAENEAALMSKGYKPISGFKLMWIKDKPE